MNKKLNKKLNNLLVSTFLFVLFLVFLVFDLELKIYYSIGTLILYVASLVKFRKNNYLFLLFFILLYFNYSIIFGEYLVGNLKLNFHNLREQEDLYIEGIKLLFIFVFMLYFFIEDNKNLELKVFKSNSIIFWLIYLLILYIGIFKINRSYS
ncbi:MAG: hypothetical protein ACRCZH_04875, partial [Cetobacterium sp.]